MVLGEVMKELRLRKGLTQEDVCRIAMITQGFYSTIEGGAIPSLDTLTKLSQVFDVPIFLLIWKATEKRDIPRHQRGMYNSLKPVLDNLIEEVITTTQ